MKNPSAFTVFMFIVGMTWLFVACEYGVSPKTSSAVESTEASNDNAVLIERFSVLRAEYSFYSYMEGRKFVFQSSDGIIHSYEGQMLSDKLSLVNKGDSVYVYSTNYNGKVIIADSIRIVLINK